MSISIYYTAKRQTPLNESEKLVVQEIIQRYSVYSKIESFIQTGTGFNWESFCFEINTSSGVVCSGSTKMPDNSDNAMVEGAQHWCACLSEIRRNLNGCDWVVSIEDYEIQWNAENRIYALG